MSVFLTIREAVGATRTRGGARNKDHTTLATIYATRVLSPSEGWKGVVSRRRRVGHEAGLAKKGWKGRGGEPSGGNVFGLRLQYWEDDVVEGTMLRRSAQNRGG